MLLGITYIFLEVSFKFDQKHYFLKIVFLATGLILVLQNIGITRSMTLFNYTSNITQVQSGIDNYYIVGSFVAILTILYFFLTYIVNLFKDFQRNFIWKGGKK